MSALTAKNLRDVLRYDSATGSMWWKERPANMFGTAAEAATWNRRFANRPAFSSDNGAGYLVGTVLSQKHKAHRVIWCLHYGDWPNGFLDHINGDRSDNRIDNLRVATSAENQRNKVGRSNSSSRFKGVSYHSGTRKWRAVIRLGGKLRSLGLHAREEDAARAYDAVAVEHHGAFARPNIA